MQKNYHEFFPRFVACLALNIFSIFPIILSGRMQYDDLSRSIDGYNNFIGAGRYFAHIMLYIINMGGPLINTFPLHQIISAILFAVASVIISEIFNIRRPIWLALSTLPLIAQPYYLENMSYAFDSVTMSAAVLAAVAAAATQRPKPTALRLAIGTSLLWMCLTLYQPAVIAFAILFSGVVVIEASRTSLYKSLNLIFASIFILIISHFIYFISVKVAIITIGPLSSHLMWNISILGREEFIEGMVENFYSYWSLLISDWSVTAYAYIAVALFISSGLYLVLPRSDLTKDSSLLNRVFALFILLIVILFSLGPLLFKQNLYLPPRFLIGVGVTLCLLNLIVISWAEAPSINSVVRATNKGLVIFLAYALIFISFAYGRASLAQKEFEAGLLTQMAGEIGPSLKDGSVNEVIIIGVIPASPILKNTVIKLPVISRLVPRHLNEGQFFGHAQLRHYGLPLKYAKTPRAQEIQKLEEGELINDGLFYELRIKNNKLIIKFIN